VNPKTNKVYAVNSSDGTVTVMDGSANSTTTVRVGSEPMAIAVNAVTNKNLRGKLSAVARYLSSMGQPTR